MRSGIVLGIGDLSGAAGRQARTALLVASAIGSLCWPTAANAGFFEFLFGAPGAVWDSSSAGDMQARQRARALPGTRKPKTKSAQRPTLTVVPKGQRTGSLQTTRDLMEDASLREGDAVMTKGGIRVFTGLPDGRHRAEDFVGLSEVRGLPTPQRSALVEIDASRIESARPPWRKPELVTGRSTVEPRVETGIVVSGRNGQTIRYVGP